MRLLGPAGPLFGENVPGLARPLFGKNDPPDIFRALTAPSALPSPWPDQRGALPLPAGCADLANKSPDGHGLRAALSLSYLPHILTIHFFACPVNNNMKRDAAKTGIARRVLSARGRKKDAGRKPPDVLPPGQCHNTIWRRRKQVENSLKNRCKRIAKPLHFH